MYDYFIDVFNRAVVWRFQKGSLFGEARSKNARWTPAIASRHDFTGAEAIEEYRLPCWAKR